MLGVVVQIDGWDPIAKAAVSLFAASHDVPEVCHLAGQGAPVWWPALAKLPTLRYDLFDGAFTGAITAPSSSLTLRTEPWPSFGRYALADARFRLWTGQVGDPWGAWTLRFDGRVTEQPKGQDGAAEISFSVDDSWLDAALLPTYAGTTGAEGTAELKGQPKPLALGAPRYVPGTLVDPINSVFQISAFGFNAVEAALERLARFGPPQGNYASFADLVAANIPGAAWATAKASGFVRFGAPPAGQISFLVQGDAAGPGGWVSKPGAVVRRLVQLANGKVDEASLTALDAARPYNVSIYIDQQTTARELIQQLAASLNCVAGVSWLGQLFIVPVAIGAPTLTLAADGSVLPPVKSVQQIEIAAPWQKLAIGAARTWSVHALADIAFTAPLIELGAYVAGTTYREGTIVTLPDGSRWLFIATTPAKGVAPAEGATWTKFSDSSKPVYADGTPIDDLKPAEPGADVTKNQLPAAWEQVTGKPATEVVSDLAGAVDTIAAEVMRGATWRGESDQVLYMPDGRPVRVAVEAIGGDVDGVKQFVAFLKEVDTSAKTSKFLFSARSDGSIVGIEGIAGGGYDQLSFVASRFLFVDESGANPVSVLTYENGLWRFGDIEARKITYESLVPKFAGEYSQLDPNGGFQVMPNGLIFQWGRYRASIGREVALSIVFPKPFPNAVMSVTATPYISTFSSFRDLWIQNVGAPTTQGASFQTQAATSDNMSLDGLDWTAFGY